jgi:excisionase family DNA binding protein
MIGKGMVPSYKIGGKRLFNRRGEACELIRVSRVTLYRMVGKGMVPSYKIGGKRLFNRRELIQWVKSQREGKNFQSISKKGE